MNKIVREHYPVANLPEDLREGFEAGAIVKVVVEVEARSPFAYAEENRPTVLGDMLKKRKESPSVYSGNLTMDEAVSIVRELRDQDE